MILDDQLLDGELDDIITGEFPRPVALLYNQMLKARNDPLTQIELCKHTFEFCIRTITLALIVRHVESLFGMDNEYKTLNEMIKGKLPFAKHQQWVELLELILKAYKGKSALFFVPELYSLYWGEESSEETDQDHPTAFRDLMVFSKRLNDKIKPSDAPEIVQSLRKIMRYFLPIQRYRLLLVYKVTDQGLDVEIHRGLGNSPSFILWGEIRGINRDNVKENYYYLENPNGDLLALDPVILTPLRLRIEISPYDVGVYSKYLSSRIAEVPSSLFYMLMTSPPLPKEHQTSDDDLISKFERLLNRLDNLERDSQASDVVPTWENITTACEEISYQQMKDNALTKYDENVYIEREELNTSVAAFLGDPTIAMMITGEAGVGKTNLLVRLYQTLKTDAAWAVMWLEGADLSPQSLAEQVLEKFSMRQLAVSRGDIVNANVQLGQFLNTGTFQGRGLLLILDGVNENEKTLDVFHVINDFINAFAGHERVKVVISSRPQVWQYARSQLMLKNYRPSNFFGSSKLIDLTKGTLSDVDQDSFVLRRYTEAEQHAAFTKYRDKHGLRNPDPDSLHPRLQRALLDPLLMSLTCLAWESDGEIPADFLPEDIIPKLIETMVLHGHKMRLQLEQADIDSFLQGRLVPKLFPSGQKPDNQLTRSMLVGDQNLEDQLADVSINSQGIPVNIRYKRLERTGWLVTIHDADNFVVRFRYEFFYDFFAGKYLYDQYKQAEDKLEVFKYLSEAPFLWGPLRNLLIDILRHEEELTPISQLARQSDDYQKQLLTSVLSEYYLVYTEKIHPLLLEWLNPNTDEQQITNAAEIAASVSVLCRVEELIEMVLCHPVERVRLGVIQNIHLVWEETPEMVIRVLVKIAQPIRWHNFILRRKPTAAAAFTLLQCALLLVMTNYSNINKKAQSVTIVDMLHQVWRPIIERLLLVRRKSWQEAIFKRGRSVVSRALIRFFIIRPMEKSLVELEYSTGQIAELVFGYKELKASFPAGPERRTIFEELIPHLEGAQPDAPIKLDDLAEKIVELARNRDFDLFTNYIVLGALDAYFMRLPLETSITIERLYQQFTEFYPPTVDPTKPTGCIWFPITAFPLGYIPLNLDHPHYLEVATTLIRLQYLKEERYRNLWPMGHGTLLQPNTVADVIPLYIGGDFKTGQSYIEKYIAIFIEREDHFQIRRCIHGVAVVTSVWSSKIRNVFEIGIHVIVDVLIRLQPYLHELEQKHPRLYKEFWEHVIDDLKHYFGKNRLYLIKLVDMCEGEIMPAYVKNNIVRDTTLQDDWNYTLMEAILWFLFDVLKDDNPYGRDLIKWGLWQVLEAKSLQDFILRCTVRATYLVYGEELL